ncbi:uncharacterized protein LOC112555397 isoform X4 [Pomacea canaliculata]|nr:uncharacterized protein LOC112555397 isoform X4 [Pomacea canaliculata]XP_025079556.1 uncharacterized protein LOC112555397 isoform X4 [Pomacea canaliculata]
MGKKQHDTKSNENADQWLTTRNKSKTTLLPKRRGCCSLVKKLSPGRVIISPLQNVERKSKIRQTSLMDFFTAPHLNVLKPLSAADVTHSDTEISNIHEETTDNACPFSLLSEEFIDQPSTPLTSQKGSAGSSIGTHTVHMKINPDNEKSELISHVLDARCFPTDCYTLPSEESSVEDKEMLRKDVHSIKEKKICSQVLMDCCTQKTDLFDMDSLCTPFFLEQSQDDSIEHSEEVVRFLSKHQGKLSTTEECKAKDFEYSDLNLGHCSEMFTRMYGGENKEEFLEESIPVRGSLSGSQSDDHRLVSSDDTVEMGEKLNSSVVFDDLQTPDFLRDIHSSLDSNFE